VGGGGCGWESFAVGSELTELKVKEFLMLMSDVSLVSWEAGLIDTYWTWMMVMDGQTY
jgi:hypothetical protein